MSAHFVGSCECELDSLSRLDEFFKLRISTNLLISQFLEMAEDESLGRRCGAETAGSLFLVREVGTGRSQSVEEDAGR